MDLEDIFEGLFDREKHHRHHKKYERYPVRGGYRQGDNCSKCGETLAPGDRFCPSCGTPVTPTKPCIQCGHEISTQFNFCPQCGTRQQ
ncbi:double zinc ribbon [Moorella thermoacetica]|uniref:Double zinc ribbon n=1 Tax=Neomoorella thermoacetica TaxID=1525 RepID=A0A1J5JSV8_NEOTH|nr:double zinc ribbon [Moorella thermoacetica]